MTAHAGRTASGSRRLANPTGTPAWAVALILTRLVTKLGA